MKARHLVILLIACASISLAGCGGGGGGGGSIEMPGVELSLTACTDLVSSKSPARPIHAVLDAGASVVAYNYATGQELARGTLDANGSCDLKLTPGLTVAVVVTGTRTEDQTAKSYRLSIIIPVVPQMDADYVADPITSIAAEALASQHPLGGGTILCDEIWDAVVDKAVTFVDAGSVTDFSLGGGVFGGTSFGAADSIDSSRLADVIQEAAKTINNDMVRAKNAVQQIKDAGTPLEMMLSQERPEIEDLYNTVQSEYSALFERLGTLISPAIFSQLSYNGDDSTRVFDLELGQAYSIEVIGGKRVLTLIGPSTAGQVGIEYQADGGTYMLVAVKNASGWVLTQTFSGDPSQEYRVTIPEIPTDPELNTTYTASVSLTDGEFTTPLTFEGSISATGDDLLLTRIRVTAEGTLVAPDVNCSARVQVVFPSQVPENAKPGSEVYEFPSSASVSNAQITVTEGGHTYQATGSLSATSEIITVDGYARAVPRTVTLSGTYTNGQSGLGFEGEMSANWSNPGADLDEMTAVGTFSLGGEITRPGYPTYGIDWSVALNAGQVTSEIEIRAGTDRLAGVATGTLVHDGNPCGTLTLTNQNSVRFVLNLQSDGYITGSVSAGSPLTEVATIVKLGEALRITYDTDPVTFDEFPLW